MQPDSRSTASSETWILDGHNVLFLVPELAAAQTGGRKEEARNALVRRAAAFAARRRLTMIVVFDGTSVMGSDRIRGVDVLYGSGPGGADDRIVAIATERVERGERVTVVTRDRALKDRLPGRARTEDPSTFWGDSERSSARSRGGAAGGGGAKEAGGSARVEEKPAFYDPEIEAHFLESEKRAAEQRREKEARGKRGRRRR